MLECIWLSTTWNWSEQLNYRQINFTESRTKWQIINSWQNVIMHWDHYSFVLRIVLFFLQKALKTWIGYEIIVSKVLVAIAMVSSVASNVKQADELDNYHGGCKEIQYSLHFSTLSSPRWSRVNLYLSLEHINTRVLSKRIREIV